MFVYTVCEQGHVWKHMNVHQIQGAESAAKMTLQIWGKKINGQIPFQTDFRCSFQIWNTLPSEFSPLHTHKHSSSCACVNKYILFDKEMIYMTPRCQLCVCVLIYNCTTLSLGFSGVNSIDSISAMRLIYTYNTNIMNKSCPLSLLCFKHNVCFFEDKIRYG